MSRWNDGRNATLPPARRATASWPKTFTDAVIASRRAELEQVAAAKERSRLLRQLGDMLATSRLGPDELLKTIVELAASTIGEGAAIRILTPDHREIER